MKKILFLMFCLTSIFLQVKECFECSKNVSIPNVQATITNAKSLQKDLMMRILLSLLNLGKK